MNLRLKITIASVMLCPLLFAETIAIIGGTGSAGLVEVPYAALIDSEGGVHPLSNMPFVSGNPNDENNITSVAMNSSGNSLMVGHQGTGGPGGGEYIGLVDPAGNVKVFGSSNDSISLFDCAINASGNGICGGGSGDAIGFRINSAGITPFSIGLPGIFASTDINGSGLAVIGGTLNADSGFLLQAPDNIALQGLGFGQNIRNISLNSSGYSIFLSNAGNCKLYNQNVNEDSIVAGTNLETVSLNEVNMALIGGQSGAAAYATLIDATSNSLILRPLSGDPIPTMGVINSVDLNNHGFGILAGHNSGTNAAYAGLVFPSGTVHNIAGLPSGSASASINSASINAWGVALLGGTPDGTNPYAVLVTPWGGFMPLTVNSETPINSVSLRNFFPFTKQLSQLLGTVKAINGNSRIFGEYITQEAPEKIAYFIPAVFAGTLSDALMSTAPTRNAISLFTADSNLLFLSHGLSVHLRNHRHFRAHGREEIPIIAAVNTPNRSQEIALFSEETSFLLEASRQKTPPAQPPACEIDQDAKIAEPVCTGPSCSLWFETIGAFASQSEQHQTPGFQPWMGGAILACDTNTNAKSLAGGGIAYTFTHISENGNQGSSRINQEYFFGYATWANEKLYFDGVLWFGFFQIHQVRNIHLTGFDFQSISNPNGWQLSPHAEFGYDHAWQFGKDKKNELILDPFVMVDWVNAWQAAYKERGKGPFNAGQKAHYSSLLRSEVGLRFYETLLFSTWRCIFEQKGSYVNKAPFGVGKVTAFLVGSPGSFTVETLSNAQNLGAVEVALIAEPLDQGYPYGSFSYQGEFGSSFQSHQLIAEASWDF